MKRYAARILRILALSALLVVLGGSAFARYHFDARFSWLTGWQANLGTDGWVKAVQSTVHEGMAPEEVVNRLGTTKNIWNPEAFTGLFAKFRGYDSVWFYGTPYPVEATIRSDGGENVEMKGAWIAFRNGKLALCSSHPPGTE